MSIAMVGIARRSRPASGIFNILRNLGDAFRTAVLATIITKRELIGNALRLPHEKMRDRIEQMAAYFAAHGTIDPAEAHDQAVNAIGNIVYTQSPIMDFSDTFAVLGILVYAAAAIVMMTKGGRRAIAAHWRLADAAHPGT
jgi:MFS transporter, DHA2 family, multidrug resistance protein